MMIPVRNGKDYPVLRNFNQKSQIHKVVRRDYQARRV